MWVRVWRGCSAGYEGPCAPHTSWPDTFDGPPMVPSDMACPHAPVFAPHGRAMRVVRAARAARAAHDDGTAARGERRSCLTAAAQQACYAASPLMRYCMQRQLTLWSEAGSGKICTVRRLVQW